MLPPVAPVVTITDNMGGSVSDFADRILDYHDQHVLVRVEGECVSACTMVTGLPRANVCVGPNASFGFHQAFTPRDPEHMEPSDVYRRSEPGVHLLMRFYPPRIRDWLKRRGGLTARMIYLHGAPLRRLFHACD